MSTNRPTTTNTPGTVKGTARVTTTKLVPGMTIRFPGNKRAGRDARTALIVAVRSELRQNGNYSKRARWYLVDFADGSGCSLAPASRHDVLADAAGAPLVEDLEAAATDPEPEAPAATLAAAEDAAPTLKLVLVDHCPQGSLF